MSTPLLPIHLPHLDLATGISAFKAASEKWPTRQADVGQAFLSGMTCEQISKLTGEARRKIQVVLNISGTTVLMTIEGFETFDPVFECLDIVRPGYWIGAPRASNLRLKEVMSNDDMIQLFEAEADGCIYLNRAGGKPRAEVSTHVDDVAGTGEPKVSRKS